MLAKVRRSVPDIDRYIEHFTPDNPDKLALGVGRLLVVQSPYHAVAGKRFIVLYEPVRPGMLLEYILSERLEKPTAIILKHFGLKKQNSWQ